MNWLDLSPCWEKIQGIARERDGQKGGYASTKNWSIGRSTHFVGVCGEYALAAETGMFVDKELRIAGDPGYDFINAGVTYDVKASTYYQSPDLKEFRNAKKWADVYVLAAVRVDCKEAAIVGWATQQQLRDAPGRDYGHGTMLSLTCHALEVLGQLGVPQVSLHALTPEKT